MFDRTTLRDAVAREGGISRRLFLAYAGSLASIPVLGRRAVAAARRITFPSDPFSVGVASGDPAAHSVVLWTRLAPKPFEPGGGLPAENIEVSWRIAKDENMREEVSHGTAVATPQLGHSMHVEADGLEPDRWYWYQFRAGDAESPIGRTRTLPAAGADPRELRFAFASCQNYEHGLFTAYEHMAEEDLDLVLHLGDYIYEYEGRDDKVRKHFGKEATSLDDYRIRHAQYKADPPLHQMHARCPWVVVWDDHEFDNNNAGENSEEAGVDPVEFLLRRANAYQAYYEMMPLRHTSLPRGPHMLLYRDFSFGGLAKFFMLDGRQHRTNQPNGDGMKSLNRDALSPQGTMLGARQRSWLQASLIDSRAQWNVLGQQIMMAMVGVKSEGGPAYYMDGWSGYAYERMQLVKFLQDRRIPNPVVLTGDSHENWVNHLRVDDRKHELPVAATELMGTSIASDGNGVEKPAGWDDTVPYNPCVQFYNGERGYVRCTVTPDLWRADFRTLQDISKPGAPITTRASFIIESSHAAAQLA